MRGLKAIENKTMGNPDLSKYYDRSAPRYTSYPTANHFTAQVSAQDQAEWIQTLPPETPLSLYLHIPFCKALCRYCGCHTRVVKKYDAISPYVSALHTEIGRVARLLGRRQRVTQIHWGGGTPTFLSDSDMSDIFSRIRAQFDLAPDAEIAMEIDPRTVSPARVKFLAAMGLTRVSLGVQDFDPDVQEAIGRIQPFETVWDLCTSLRGIGVRNINFDLIYGLPRQSEESLRKTMRRAASLNPDRLAVFGYAHVPWFKAQQKILERYTLPGPAERFAMAQITGEILENSGYYPIGIDHFAKPGDSLVRALENGTLRRNFQGYTADQTETLIGFGASAISTLPSGYVQNDASIEGYQDLMAGDGLAGKRGIRLNENDFIRRQIIEQLMCFFESDLEGLAPFERSGIFAALASLESDGLLTRTQTGIAITQQGKPFTRLICTAFDSVWQDIEGRHAKAV